jgi:hypothetical protein
MLTPMDRFMSKIQVAEDGCWVWSGYLLPGGYGTLSVYGRTVLAHRFAYTELVGDIPPGLVIDHLCRNRACVNPDHLEPVSMRENLMRGEGLAAANVTKKACPSGHAYDVANTYTDRTGRRHCRTCHRGREVTRRKGVVSC